MKHPHMPSRQLPPGEHDMSAQLHRAVPDESTRDGLQARTRVCAWWRESGFMRATVIACAPRTWIASERETCSESTDQCQQDGAATDLQ